MHHPWQRTFGGQYSHSNKTVRYFVLNYKNVFFLCAKTKRAVPLLIPFGVLLRVAYLNILFYVFLPNLKLSGYSDYSHYSNYDTIYVYKLRSNILLGKSVVINLTRCHWVLQCPHDVALNDT